MNSFSLRRGWRHITKLFFFIFLILFLYEHSIFKSPQKRNNLFCANPGKNQKSNYSCDYDSNVHGLIKILCIDIKNVFRDLLFCIKEPVMFKRAFKWLYVNLGYSSDEKVLKIRILLKKIRFLNKCKFTFIECIFKEFSAF